MKRNKLEVLVVNKFNILFSSCDAMWKSFML